MFDSFTFKVIINIVVQLLDRVWLFATSWTTARQASLSFPISMGLLKLMSIESVMPSNHLILSPPLTPSLSQHQGLFQQDSSSHQVTKFIDIFGINSTIFLFAFYLSHLLLSYCFLVSCLLGKTYTHTHISRLF